MNKYGVSKGDRQNVRFAGGRHSRQLCSLLLTLAMLLSLVTVSMGAVPPPLKSEAPTIFEPVYDTHESISGTGIPNSKIEVIVTRSGVVNIAETTVNSLGVWTMSTTANIVLFNIEADDEIEVTQTTPGALPSDPVETVVLADTGVTLPNYEYMIRLRLITATGIELIPGVAEPQGFTGSDNLITAADLIVGVDYPRGFEFPNGDRINLSKTRNIDALVNGNRTIFTVFYEINLNLYKVTVNYNFGSFIDEEFYEENDVVAIDAYAHGPNAGSYFTGWEAISPEVMFTTTANITTDFIMPKTDVEIRATWRTTGGGSGGSGGSGGGGVNPPQPGDKGGEGGDEETGEGEEGTLPAHVLPRFAIGLENDFIPMDIFNPNHIPYIYGYTEGDVEPDANITRAEAAALLFRILSDPERFGHADNHFEFADWEWYTEPVTYLVDIGVINGYADGTFRADNNMTRAEFAALICKLGMTEGPIVAEVPDIAGHWAEEYIKIGLSNGWLSGYPDGSFQPDGYIERAEVVSLINRLLFRGIEAEDVPDWAPEFWDLTPDHWAYAEIIEAASGHEFERKDNGYEIWLGELE